MATPETISEALKLIPEMKSLLRQAFDDLQSHSSSLSSFSLTWSDLDSHFSALQSAVESKLKLLQSRPEPTIDEPIPEVEAEEGADVPAPPEPRTEPLQEEKAEEGVDVPVRAEVRAFCEKMDGLGLRNYIVSQRPKERLLIRDELRDAFKCARDAATMVLDALEGFIVPNSKGDKNVPLFNVRKACIIMFEGLMLSKVEISPEVRERAKSLALNWKEKVNTDGLSTFEPYGFLHLVANYGLVDVFSLDELFDMAVVIASKFMEGVRLIRMLSFGDKISDLIQRFISNGKQLLAVKYVLEFELTGKFPPVFLMQDFVNDAKKKAQKIREDGKHSSESLNEANTKETSSLKSVLNLIEDRKLEAELLKRSVMKRLEVLEKERANRKKKPGQNLSGTKRPRATTHVQIPNRVSFPSSANNLTIHQAAVPHSATTNQALSPFGQSYSSGQISASTQPHIYNANLTVQAYQQLDPQFAPGGQMIVPNVASNVSSTVPPYQQFSVQHTPGGQATTRNVATAGEAVPAYQQSDRQFAPVGQMTVPNVASTVSSTVPPNQQFFVQLTPGGQAATHNVSIAGEGVPAHQQSYLHPASSLPDRCARYSSFAAYGLAGSNAVAQYASSSAGGLYGSAEASLGIAGGATHVHSHPYPTDPNTASGYYGGYDTAPQYHPSYQPQ